MDKRPEWILELIVVNAGRQPVTVMSAGFAKETTRTGRWPRRRLTPTLASANDMPQPQRLAPGEPMTIELSLVNPFGIDIENPPRGFATDGRSRTTWAEPVIPSKLFVDVWRDKGWITTPAAENE